LSERRLRALVVSYAFPPWGEVGGLRILNFCRRLPQYGIDPVVLTVKEECYDSRDNSVSVPSDLTVVRTGVITNPLDWYGKVKPGAAPTPNGQRPSKDRAPAKPSRLRRDVLAALHIPDRYWGWYWPALSAAGDLLRREKFDVVFSSGPPWIPHLIARQIKHQYRIPWLADFRDPWAILSHGNVERPPWWNRLAIKMESQCVRHADLVICNTQRLQTGMQQAYSQLTPEKFRFLSNGFDDAVSVQLPRTERTAQKLLLHLGSLYGERRIDTFLLAFARLLRSARLPAGSAKIIFQGDADPKYIAQANQIVPNLIADWSVEFRPRVSFQEAKQLLWKSDLLLLFQGSHALQLPAKFYEYLQTGIPIFAVCDEGALSDVIAATQAGIWTQAADGDRVAEKLLAALRMPRRTPEEINRTSSAYQYSSLTQRLAGWMQELAVKTTFR
jgi:glycosyltransferase involved in cell wall biosynthesis